MEIKINNGDLMKVNDFLIGAELGSRASRARMKLQKKVNEKLMEFSTDTSEISSEFKGEERREEFLSLIKEDVVIDMTEYKHLMSVLYDALADYPHSMQGDDAVAHDFILDELEKHDLGNNEPKDTEEAQIKEVEGE